MKKKYLEYKFNKEIQRVKQVARKKVYKLRKGDKMKNKHGADYHNNM